MLLLVASIIALSPRRAREYAKRPMTNMTPLEAVPAIVEAVNLEMAERLKELLQGKHIYQRVTVDVPGVVVKQIGAQGLRKETLDGILASFESDSFFPGTEQLFYAGYGSQSHTPTPMLLVKNVKLSCGSCGQLETFAPIWMGDIANDLLRPVTRSVRYEAPSAPASRIYHLTFQCQTCKGEPETFLVRRRKWALTIDGRSPMEQVDVPGFVPKAERWLYRDALVAAHGGKVLAGLFYLRTFAEAFARRVTNTSGRLTGDELMDAYNQTLPEKQRDLMPSLRQWYAKLSEAIHAAREDTGLFEEALAAVNQHFEIRKVFKIPETVSAA